MNFFPLLDFADSVTCRPAEFQGSRTYYATTDVDGTNLLDGTPVTYWNRPSRANLAVERNDVLFAKMQTTDKIVHVNGATQNAIFSTGFFNLRPNRSRLHSRYLFWYLRSSVFQIAKDNLCTGATLKTLTLSGLREIEISLPDTIDEQKRVAIILDKADDVRRKCEQSLTLTEDLHKSAFLEMFGDPAVNPHGWPMGTIRDLVSEVNYGTLQKASEREGKYKILRKGNITYSGQLDSKDLKYVDIEPESVDKFIVRKDDILFNRTNSRELVGKTTVFDLDEAFAYAGDLVRARVNRHADPYYISGFLNSNYGKKTVQSMCKKFIGMANINTQEFQNISIPIPPLERQMVFRRFSDTVKEQTRRWQMSLTEAKSLTATLLERAFRRGI